MAESSDAGVIDPLFKTENQWLVKVPGELAKMIEVAADGEKIGVFREEKQPTGAGGYGGAKRKKQRFSIEIDESIATRREKNIGGVPRPRHAKLNLSQDSLKMAVFTEAQGEQGRQVSITAKITHQGNLAFDQSDERAANLNRERLLAAFDEEMSHQTKDYEKDPAEMDKWGPTNAIVSTKRKDIDAKIEKKYSGDGVTDEDIKKRLFKRFVEFGHYTLTNLYHLEKLPQARIRPVLQTIAVLKKHDSGGMKWCLKDELQERD